MKKYKWTVFLGVGNIISSGESYSREVAFIQMSKAIERIDGKPIVDISERPISQLEVVNEVLNVET